MSYELVKPYTDDERAKFVNQYAVYQGLRIRETDLYVFALEPNEIMGKKEIVEDEETIIIDYPVIDEDYDEKQETRREAEFNKAFFNTSLGYVRRSVTMADGSHKDFLSDLLPAITTNVQGGVTVNILTYDKPPFDHDIDDWTEYQHRVEVTAQFIQECSLQLSNDFLPINDE